MIDRVDGGMSFEEILETEDNDDLYFSLVSNLINNIDTQTTAGAESTFNELIDQLVNGNAEQQNAAADGLSSVLDLWSEQLETLIESDLDAQDSVRKQLENLNIAAEIDPDTTNIRDSKLYDLIATPKFKELFETDVDAG